MNLKPVFIAIDDHKVLFNIGATLDIPTGFWICGIYGERILMGGLGPLTGIVGPGNMFKSTLLHYMFLCALARVFISFPETSGSTYDSESNMHKNRLRQFVERFIEFAGLDILSDGTWIVSDSDAYTADEWWEVLREYLKEKRKNMKQFTTDLPFFNRDGKRASGVIPTFSEMDSISAMNMNAGMEIMDKNNIGDSGGSHLFMREGLAKAQMLHELPALASAATHFVLSTAHIGPNNTMSSGPGQAPPKKQLQFLSTDTKIKGVSGQFLYQQHNLWLVTNCTLLWNKDDKTPKFPKTQGEAVVGDTDLNMVSIQHLRGKAGPSGFKLDIVLSQSEGVLAALTEFNLLKDYDSFGFEGNDRTYRLHLVPDITLQRTTVRQKLDENKKLRRAMNITSELAQMHMYHKPFHPEVLMSAEDLYKKVKDAGYDWDWILENTRGWWTYKNEFVGDFYLSTYDLLNMALGIYHPYWMEADKKTVKKEYVRKPTSESEKIKIKSK